VATYCPRLVSVGSRGSLGSLSSSGTPGSSSAAADQPNVFTWSGNVTKSVAKPHERNLFLQSLSEEEQNTSSSNDQNNAKKSVDDKDLVESLENGVKFGLIIRKFNITLRACVSCMDHGQTLISSITMALQGRWFQNGLKWKS